MTNLLYLGHLCVLWLVQLLAFNAVVVYLFYTPCFGHTEKLLFFMLDFANESASNSSVPCMYRNSKTPFLLFFFSPNTSVYSQQRWVLILFILLYVYCIVHTWLLEFISINVSFAFISDPLIWKSVCRLPYNHGIIVKIRRLKELENIWLK
jgi:hypothetical protein